MSDHEARIRSLETRFSAPKPQPTAYPECDAMYTWNEDTLAWVETTENN